MPQFISNHGLCMYEMDRVPYDGLQRSRPTAAAPSPCSFCEWGTLESPRRVRSVEAPCREFDGMARTPVAGALRCDAGLNLNPHAFRKLREAVEYHATFGIGRSSGDVSRASQAEEEQA
jgi:hypothetical protein